MVPVSSLSVFLSLLICGSSQLCITSTTTQIFDLYSCAACPGGCEGGGGGGGGGRGGGEGETIAGPIGIVLIVLYVCKAMGTPSSILHTLRLDSPYSIFYGLCIHPFHMSVL